MKEDGSNGNEEKNGSGICAGMSTVLKVKVITIV